MVGPAQPRGATFRGAAERVLREAGNPLHYVQISARALAAGLITTAGRTPDQTMGSQLYTAVRELGDRSVFVRVGRGVFGLRGRDEAPPEAPAPPAVPRRTKRDRAAANVVPLVGDPVERLCAELEGAQFDSANSVRFEQALARAFAHLGFDAQHLGGSGDTDILVSAHLGRDRYSAVVDAKSARHGKISDSAINWLALDSHRKQREATHAAVVGSGFAGGNLTRWADEYQVALLPTAALIEAVRLHRDAPFSLYDLRPLFSTPGQSDYVLEQLRKQAQAARAHWRLLMEIVQRVDEYYRAVLEGMEVRPDNLHYMFAYMGQYTPAIAPSIAELGDALAFLASRAVGILRPISGGDGYQLAMPLATARGRLQALALAVATAPEPDSAPTVLAETPPVGPKAPSAPRVLRPLGEAPAQTADTRRRGYEVGREVREQVLARLRALGRRVEPLPDARSCWRVGAAIYYLRFSNPLSQSGNAHFYWCDLRREVLERAAQVGPVYVAFALGSADHLLIIPIEEIRDLLEAEGHGDTARWHLEARGRPGVDPLRLYVPPRQLRDASRWYEALPLLPPG